MGLFGPSKAEVWSKLSEEIGGEYVDGGFWKGDRVEVQVGEWIIVLDTYAVSTGKTTVIYTRMRAPYLNPDGFRFKIYRMGFFSSIGLALGLQDITVGDPNFDNAFIIQGNDEEKVRKLFANSRIRELIAEQPAILFRVKDDEGVFGKHFPEGVDELSFEVVGVIKDLERLKHLYELFGEVLHQLCEMGSAYYNDPEIRL